MNKNRERLKKYLRAKNDIIYDETGLYLYSEEDIAEVDEWSEDFCWEFLDVLDDFSSDCGRCPWCSIYISTCHSDCTFGKRNGICSAKENDIYATILRKVDNISITDIPGIKDIKV